MAIAHQQTVATSNTGASSITYTNLAVGSGSDRSLVAYVAIVDGGSTTTHIDSVVFNTTESFTQRATAVNLVGGANTVAVEVWTLDNPSNATANVVATASESATCLSLIVSEYTGANNGVGANTGSATGLSLNPSTTFTTGASTSLICAGANLYSNTDRALTPGTGTTERHEGYNGTGSLNYWAGDEPATGGSNTTDCTADGTNAYWAIAAAELKEAGAAPATTPSELMLMGVG